MRPPCAPSGFPSSTTRCMVVFSRKPTSRVNAPISSMPLLATLSSSKDLFSISAAPRTLAADEPSALKDKSRWVNTALVRRELHKTSAPSIRIIFQCRLRVVRGQSGEDSSSARDSPPVTKSGCTTLRFSSLPSRLLLISSSFRCLFLISTSTKLAHSPSSIFALDSLRHCRRHSGFPTNDARASAASGPMMFWEMSSISSVGWLATAAIIAASPSSPRLLSVRFSSCRWGIEERQDASTRPILLPRPICAKLIVGDSLFRIRATVTGGIL
mmetsp:Transcript_2637/g.6090  ORF Transcript_2637/g.6090 Transcript_2637/m.6090 type:complete len:271 (+) Transcript_2637:3017-3829(+)